MYFSRRHYIIPNRQYTQHKMDVLNSEGSPTALIFITYFFIYIFVIMTIKEVKNKKS